ncbi:CapA family protein [Mariluticola halotolerans]|uniref:CapA family protein n=1 Tax=Mariluticola halotolerans TaxID=2909283 RepID=UPI0026E3936C|nr:CapA family protein [Mariluticola halotolerans]UJQ94869.1 CapA family protein [Mariluticola halotolerans]
MSGDVNFIAVGDVAPDREEPGTIFNHVRERIRKADLGFCQLEVNLTERGQRVPQARHTMRGDPGIADALVDAGLEVVSFAGNHAMDWGPEGLLDTIANLNRAGASQVGTGPDITAARKPVIVTRNGLKVGFVAVNSILPMNYWADENKPGCAPVRGFTVYEQIEHDQPGTPARIHTYPHHGDLEATLDAIRWTKQRADVVVFSHHAGIHFVQAVIPDYQRDVAYAAIDAGADLVLGHHAHILKGAEVYKGVPILYSLANFAIELTMTKEHAESKGFREIQKLNPDWVPDLESRYNFPPDSAMSIAVEARLTSNGVADLRLVPVFIDRTADPQFVPPEDARFGRILNYLQKISDEAGLATEFTADGDVIRLKART